MYSNHLHKMWSVLSNKLHDCLEFYFGADEHTLKQWCTHTFCPKNDNKALFHLAIAGGTASILFKVSYTCMTLIHF